MTIQTDASETSSRTTALSKEATEIGIQTVHEAEKGEGGAGNLSLDVMGKFVERLFNPKTDIIVCPIDLTSQIHK